MLVSDPHRQRVPGVFNPFRMVHLTAFFATRRYASAAYAVVVCLCVRLCVLYQNG